jgi:iron complex transport system substrate-binding protein
MRTRSRTSVLLSVLLVLSVLTGAVPAAASAAGAAPGTSPALQESGTCEFPVTVTDVTGTEVTVEERPERVTTLAPSAAQTMWEIGGKEQVVGVSRYASYLNGTESLANVSGGSGGVSVETVVETEPDLVLAPNVVPNETVAALRDAGLTVVKFEKATSIEDVREKTTLIGELTGNCEGAAETNAWVTANVEAARNATSDVDRPGVFYALGGGFTAGEGTFIDSMITVAGGENLAATAANATGYAKVSDETVVEIAPETVVVTYPGAVDFSAEPWASTPAAENNSTVQVNPNYLNQPAPRSVVFGVRNLTAGFHPEAYDRTRFPSQSEVAAGTGTPATSSNGTETPTAAGTAGSGADTTTGAAGDDAATTTDGETTSAESPGFGAGVAAVALLASALLARRRN